MITNVDKLKINNEMNLTDPQKRATSFGSCILENSLTRRDYQHKGKEM